MQNFTLYILYQHQQSILHFTNVSTMTPIVTEVQPYRFSTVVIRSADSRHKSPETPELDAMMSGRAMFVWAAGRRVVGGGCKVVLCVDTECCVTGVVIQAHQLLGPEHSSGISRMKDTCVSSISLSGQRQPRTLCHVMLLRSHYKSVYGHA